MPEITVPIVNPSGLHARPAANLVRAASGFGSDINLTNLTRDAERTVSAKSLLSVLTLGVSQGHQVRIAAEGDDADEALAELTSQIAAGLGEGTGA